MTYQETIQSLSFTESTCNELIDFIEGHASDADMSPEMHITSIFEEEFRLNLSVDEEKTKRSIQSNQVVSKLDYELTMIFSLENIGKDCIIYENTIYSRFSYVPKSSGYNFGSDQSLEKLYELAAKETFEKIINLLSAADLSSCKNED